MCSPLLCWPPVLALIPQTEVDIISRVSEMYFAFLTTGLLKFTEMTWTLTMSVILDFGIGDF